MRVIEIGAALKPKERDAVLDEFARLDIELSPKEARRKHLREQILSWFPSAKPEQELVLETSEHVVTIGAAGRERRIVSVQKLARALGMRVFWGIASVRMKAFDAVVPEAERCKYVVDERAGPRRVSAAARLTTAA